MLGAPAWLGHAGRHRLGAHRHRRAVPLAVVAPCVLFVFLALFSLTAAAHGALGALVVPVVLALEAAGITELGYRWARLGYVDLGHTLADVLDWPPGWSISTCAAGTVSRAGAQP
jgi:hypothetical protein